MIRFCIVATARSGTSYLVTALASPPTVICHGEIFHPNHREHIAAEYLDVLNLDLREHDPTTFVDQVYGLRPEAYAAGFKIFRGHNDIALEYILASNDIRKIILQRENALGSYSSLLIAEKTGHWQERSAPAVPPTPPEAAENSDVEQAEPIYPTVTFDPASFLTYWDWERDTFDHYRSAISAAGGAFLDVDYLTLTSGDFSNIERFLDLPVGFRWQTDICKLNPRHMLERFYNPADVLAFTREWKLEHWLHE
jgi:hypothetical protein